VTWRVEFSLVARGMFSGIPDRSVRRKLLDAAQGLEGDPEKQGKPLTGEFEGLRRLRFSRYRMIYSVDSRRSRVVVVALGLRKAGSRTDIYALAAHLAKAGVLLAEARPRG